MISRTLLGAFGIAVAALGACGDEDDPAAGTAPPPSAGPTSPGSPVTLPPVPATAGDDLAALLDGREFLSTAVEGRALVEGSQVRLSFDGDQLGVSPGCNSGGATFSVDADRLIVDGVGITEMACEPAALMDQDTWVIELLTGQPTLGLDGDTLTVSGRDGAITFTDREVADPDRPLQGTPWTLESIIGADVVASVPATMRTPTLTIAGGRVDVDTGCNTGGADVTVGEGELTIGPLVLTRMACTDPAAQEVEERIIAVLADTVSVDVEADRLTITNGDLGLGYTTSD